jgi:hypothetical protein
VSLQKSQLAYVEVENLKDTFLRVPHPNLPLGTSSASYLSLALFVSEPP